MASGPYLSFRTNTHAQSVKPRDAKSQCHRHRSCTPFTVHKEAMGLHAPLWCVKARGFLPYPNPIGCISHVISLGNNHGVQFRETRFHFAIFFGLFLSDHEGHGHKAVLYKSHFPPLRHSVVRETPLYT